MKYYGRIRYAPHRGIFPRNDQFGDAVVNNWYNHKLSITWKNSTVYHPGSIHGSPGYGPVRGFANFHGTFIRDLVRSFLPEHCAKFVTIPFKTIFFSVDQ